MSTQLLLILLGGAVILALFAGLTWLFVWISRNNPNAPRSSTPQLPAPKQQTKPQAKSQPPAPSAVKPGMNREARRRQGRD